MLRIVNFPRNSLAFCIFLRIQFASSYLGLGPNRVLIPCKQPAFYHVFHRGQSPDRQQPINDPSSKYYPFLLFNVSSLMSKSQFIFGQGLLEIKQSFSLLSVVELSGILSLR